MLNRPFRQKSFIVELLRCSIRRRMATSRTVCCRSRRITERRVLGYAGAAEHVRCTEARAASAAGRVARPEFRDLRLSGTADPPAEQLPLGREPIVEGVALLSAALLPKPVRQRPDLLRIRLEFHFL